ncbi:hypothetical protein ACVW0K_007041 [Streptomyces filamentosus]
MDLLPSRLKAPREARRVRTPLRSPSSGAAPERAGVIPPTVALRVFSLHLLHFPGFMALLPGADRPPAEGFPLRPLLARLTTAALPAAAYHAPRVRRRSARVPLVVSGLALFMMTLDLLFRLILAS